MGRREDNIVQIKSFNFAIRIVNLYKFLCYQRNEFVLSKQLLKSGTSIGANIHEAQEAISKKDFSSKIYIALKEARETEYWLKLLRQTSFLQEDEHISICNDCEELLKLLVSIAKSLKE